MPMMNEADYALMDPFGSGDDWAISIMQPAFMKIKSVVMELGLGSGHHQHTSGQESDQLRLYISPTCRCFGERETDSQPEGPQGVSQGHCGVNPCLLPEPD